MIFLCCTDDSVDEAPLTEAAYKRLEAAKAKPWSISTITEAGISLLLKSTNFIIEEFQTLESLHAETTAGFEWGHRTESQGTSDAVHYLRDKLFTAGVNFGNGGYKLVDVHANKNLLNVPISDEIRLSGSTDAIIVPYLAAEASFSVFACVLFELKTSNKLLEDMKKCSFQLLSETVAARYLSEQPAVLCVLTDLNRGGVIATTTWDSDCRRIVVQKSELLPLDAVFHYVRDFLGNKSIPSTRFNPNIYLEGIYDPKFEQVVEFKRGLKRTHGESFAMEQFEELIEGTAPFSRDRALAVRHLFQAFGEEVPRIVSDYSHMYS